MLDQQKALYGQFSEPLPDTIVVQSVIQQLRDQGYARACAGPDVQHTLNLIRSASYISDADRPLLWQTLRILASRKDFPDLAAQAFQCAPSPAVRRLADIIGTGFHTMLAALANADLELTGTKE